MLDRPNKYHVKLFNIGNEATVFSDITIVESFNYSSVDELERFVTDWLGADFYVDTSHHIVEYWPMLSDNVEWE